MIFKTIKDDVTGANKSIGLFGLSLNDVSNKLYDIQTKGLKNTLFNTPTIEFDEKAITLYNQKIEAGATAQDALTIASKNTNSATIAFMQSANGATISTEQMVAAQEASTFAARAQSAAYKAVSIAANMIAYALIAKGIQLAADAIDHYVNRAKYAAEAMEEAQQKIDEAQNSLKNISTTLSENKDRFLELSQGVNKFSKNLSLSEEDYAEYLSISNELAELFPTLVSGYDEQGNALLSIGNNADETNEKLQSLLETQQAVAQQTLIDNMDDVATGIHYEVEDAKSSIEEMEVELASLQQQYKEFNVDIANSKGIISFSDDDYSKYGKAMEDALTSAGIEFEKNASDGLYDTAIQLISASPEQLAQAQKFYDSWLETENEYFHASENGLKQDIEKKKKSIENSYSKMTANLQAWMKDNYNYQYLSDNASNLADALVPEIKWDELEEPPTTAWDYQNYVEENIIKPLMEVPQKHRQEIDNMFKKLLSFEDGDLDVLPFAEKLQTRLKELGIEIDITPIIADEQEAKNRLQNSIEAITEGGKADFTTSSGIKVDVDDYKKLQKYTEDFSVEQEELWNKVTLGAKNAEDAINKYEKALKSVPNTDKLTLSDAKSLVQGADGTEGLISEIQLLQEVLADTGNISQETYEKLLSCSKDYATAIRTENGRITLNTTKLKQVAKQRQLDTKATIKETLAIKKQEWLQWKNKIENYNGTLLDSIEAKYDDIDALQAEITQYELLVNSLDSATSAFERFKAAQSTSNQDMYDTAQDAFNVLKEYSSDSSSENYGKYNTDEFQEAAMLLMDSDTYKKALNAKDLTEYQKVVNGFVKSISPLFDENNAKSASKLFDEVDKIIASGDTPVADQDWADRLGISKEAFNALKQLANLYGYNGLEISESFQLDRLDDYQEKLSNVVAERKALNEIEDKSSNEYLKQEQSLKQAEEKYNSFLQNNAETMTNAFANYSKTNGLINGENVTFADYVKEQFDFEDTDIQGSTLALIDQADKLQSKLNTITSDKNAQKQFAEYDQLQLIIGALSAMGFEYENVANNKEKFNEALEADTSKSRTKALESDMESLEKLQEQEKKFKEQMATSTYGSEMYAEAQAGLAQVQSQLQGLKESLKMKLELDISDVETKLQKTQEEKTQFEKSNAGLEGTMFYTSQMNSYNEQIERDTATKNELEKTLEVIVEDEEALGKLNELDSFEIAGKEFAVTAIDSATSVVESVNSMKIADKNFKITASVGVSQVSGSTNLGNLGGLGGSVSKVVSDAASKVSGFGGAYGTANISGHAYADGNIGTDKELKNVMVGEVAPEMVVDPHSGEYTIYQNPTMLDKLPKNAIVFNGKQTKEILENGMTTSFGKAYANGNVSGNAFATGTKWNIPLMTNTKTNNPAFSGNTGNAGKEASDTIEDTTEDVKEASEEIFDWIERRIQKFQRLFDKWLKQAETAITSGFVTKYYKKATSSLTSLLKTQAKAYTRYMEEANKVGLPEEYAKKVRNGTID